MDLMLIRRELMQPHVKTYGGIAVMIDNYKIKRSSRLKLADSLIQDNDWFIAGVIDTGSTGSKTYEYFKPAIIYPDGQNAAFRLYNDITSTSVDWWAANNETSNTDDVIATITSAGRYIYWSIYKPKAALTYAKIKGTNTYLIKGKSVR